MYLLRLHTHCQPSSKADIYPLPRINDLLAKLAEAQVLSKLDMSQAYQQLSLDEKSKKYVTINTHKGLFRVNQLPFGVSAAPVIFQRTMKNLLQGVRVVVVYLDDILVTGHNHEQHLQQLEVVFQRLQEAGLRLKKTKCQFIIPSVQYLGVLIDAEGLHPTNEKIRVVQEASPPTSVRQVKAYLGPINYYSSPTFLEHWNSVTNC